MSLRKQISTIALLAVVALTHPGAVASAETAAAQQVMLPVPSAAMGRDIPVRVNLPADTTAPRPVLYLLDGIYRAQVTDLDSFLADKNVIVVSPAGAADGYWADWQKPGPEGYRYQWETFLTEELPQFIETTFHTTGVSGIAGMSRTGTAALRVAAKNPGKYQAVAAYSACAQTSDPLGEQSVRLTMQHVAGMDASDMWGESGDPAWIENDAFVHAAGLRGSTVYVSTGIGLPGKWDHLGAPEIGGSVERLANQIFVGGGIEAATAACTTNFQNRLSALHIPAKFDFDVIGNHSWGYWQDDLKLSWPTISRALGV